MCVIIPVRITVIIKLTKPILRKKLVSIYICFGFTRIAMIIEIF